MQYFAAYRFAFESPKWAIHLLIGTVCQFVPFVGPMVLMGYIYSVIEAKQRHGEQQFPNFDFDRLGAYLTRGVWPLLVSVLMMLPLLLLIIPAVFLFALSAAAAGRSNDSRWFLVILVIAGMLVFALSTFVLHIIALPMVLRAGLSQDFSSAFSMPYVRDFLSKVWKELLLAMLFMIVTAPFVLLAGLLLFFIGIYPAGVVLHFAQLHFHYQLYQLYLRRGGTPIPLKEEPGSGLLVTP